MKFARILSSTALVCTLAACASNSVPQLPAYSAPPPMPMAPMPVVQPPPPPKDGIVKDWQKRGATLEARAGEDRLYSMKIGSGSLTEPPEMKWVELPAGAIYNEAICDNSSLYDIYGTFTGARNPTYMVAVKALEPALSPRRGECSLMTSEGRFQLRLNVVPGRAGGATTIRLKGDGSREARQAQNIIAPAALCQDNFFTWQRTVYWAPMSVCATSNSMVVTLDPRTQQMPTVMKYGLAGWEKVNFQIAGKAITIIGVHQVVRLTGEGGSYVDVTRTGAGTPTHTAGGNV